MRHNETRKPIANRLDTVYATGYRVSNKTVDKRNRTEPMAKAKPRAISTPATTEQETTVKFPRDLARMAATLAAHRGVGMATILDGLIRQPLTVAHEQMGREIAANARRGN